jgi:von Willebrand factor type A domain.
MKRTIARLVTVLCSLFALQFVPAVASESFTLNIPLRFNPQQETGEIRITLTLNAGSSGAQLVLNGNTTLNLGDTKPVAGDSVTFETAGGNDVRITYKPLSNFGVDFCNAQNAVEKNIPMRFSGPQDVTAYRISSYIVASPMVECSAVSKHTGDTPANLIPVSDGVAPALTATNKGRHPFDVLIVLDKSGSMAGLPPGAMAGAAKVQILKSAITNFVAEWRQMDQPTIDGAEWSADRIGNVFFDNAATAQTLPGADPPTNVFVKRGSAMPGPWDAVINNVNSLTPGGSTSIGGGINEAMKQWKLDPANDLSLIVVTDGMQNTAPLIAPTASGFLGLTPVSGFPQELRKRFVPIQTIGFGTPAAVDATLLTNVSFETSGVSYISANAATMFDALGMTLIALLKGNTASMALSHHDTMTGKGPSGPQPVIVDHSAQRVVFTVQWAPPARVALDLEVFRPNGTAAVPDSAEKTPQGSFQMFNIRPSDIGTWTVRVKRGLNQTADPVPYNLNALILERHLDYTLSVEPGRAAAGDKLTVRAVVDWDGRRLAGLPAGAIRVRIQRPNESLGTILHGARFEDKPIDTTTTPASDTLTPYERKLAALTSDILKRIQPTDVATIELKEQSRGIYAGTFDQTSIAGTYELNAVLDWDDPRTGHVRRLELLEKNIKVKSDPGKTEIKTTRADARTVLIAVTPRDKSGNFLGPGYASLVKAKLASAGRLAGTPVDRDQTGTYVFTVTEVPAGETPDADITVDGVFVGNPRRL